MVYSVISRSTFDDVHNFMTRLLRLKEEEYFAVVFVGNKCDSWDRRVVTTEEGRSMAAEYAKKGILTSFMET